jgi:hypothetical protein
MTLRYDDNCTSHRKFDEWVERLKGRRTSVKDACPFWAAIDCNIF